MKMYLNRKKCLCTLTTILACFEYGIMELTYTPETSISNFHTYIGKMETTTINGYTNCIVECYLEPKCVMVGYVTTTGGCQKYSIDLTGFTTNIIAQSNTVFYKASCSINGYTYVGWLSTCIKRVYSAPQNFSDAKKVCDDDGTSLLEVDSNDKRDYLRDTLFQIHSTDFQYLLGGVSVTDTVWQWENGGNITFGNGAMFWDANEPNITNGDCMTLKSLGSDLVFVAANCSDINYFICASTIAIV